MPSNRDVWAPPRTISHAAHGIRRYFVRDAPGGARRAADLCAAETGVVVWWA
ncbi:hypothetical protein [Nocardia sp. NBC_01388]|uniref:hypothetical protein n=1 Tax=Nocardia sp. NBC_01388 TaxID=2903596 RepID=UPI003245156C